MTDFDLDSPVGRRMLQEILAWTSNRRSAKESLASALRVAMDDTCPTCGRQSIGPKGGMLGCPNPDCKDGKVPPALWTEDMVHEYAARAVNVQRSFDKTMEAHRVQVVEDFIQYARRTGVLSDKTANIVIQHWKDECERRERERQ